MVVTWMRRKCTGILIKNVLFLLNSDRSFALTLYTWLVHVMSWHHLPFCTDFCVEFAHGVCVRFAYIDCQLTLCWSFWSLRWGFFLRLGFAPWSLKCKQIHVGFWWLHCSSVARIFPEWRIQDVLLHLDAFPWCTSILIKNMLFLLTSDLDFCINFKVCGVI